MHHPENRITTTPRPPPPKSFPESPEACGFGKIRGPFSSAVNPDFQQIVVVKEAERPRLRALPWLEKLEMLDRLRDRHLLLRRMQPQPGKAEAEATGIAVG